MAGYSGKPLFEKLGLKPAHRVFLWNAPQSYQAELKPLRELLKFTTRPEGPLDFVHLFTDKRKQLEEQLSRLKKQLDQKGCIWISWPKKSAGVKTDLDENVVRNIGLNAGLVDVKVCAVDEIWSGLKFVYRLKDRK